MQTNLLITGESVPLAGSVAVLEIPCAMKNSSAGCDVSACAFDAYTYTDTAVRHVMVAN